HQAFYHHARLAARATPGRWTFAPAALAQAGAAGIGAGVIMRTVHLPEDCSEEQFRQAARQCIAQDLAPDRVLFVSGGAGSLFEMAADVDAPRVTVPRSYQELLSKVICHNS